MSTLTKFNIYVKILGEYNILWITEKKKKLIKKK